MILTTTVTNSAVADCAHFIAYYVNHSFAILFYKFSTFITSINILHLIVVLFIHFYVI